MNRRLPGSEKYRREPEVSEAYRRSHAVIERANDVPIQQLLADEFNIHVPSEVGRSWKTYCPLVWEHLDGGADKTLRVYPSNSAYCFALHGMLTPVRLVMLTREMGAMPAARWLCERYGLEGEREPYWKRMPKLVLERETRRSVGGSPEHAVAALQTALLGVPGYAERQYDAAVTTEVERWLEALDELMEHSQEGAIKEWFRQAVGRITELV